MRQLSRFDFFLATLLICVPFFFCEPIAAQKPPTRPPGSNPGSGMGTGIGQPPRMYSVNGRVTDAESHTDIDGVRVDLRAFTGGTVATVFTSGAGNFEFSNIAGGSYEIVVQQQGYQTLTQHVDVEGSTFGLFLELRPTPRSSSMAPGSQKVSARELSIPRKAHEDMEKGLTLLYGKSDLPGSIKQFERAIQEYPGYYEAYAQMGAAYMQLKNTASSEQALRKSVELSEEHYVDAYFWLATLLSNGQRYADAEPVARKAVEIDPNSWQANSELSRALIGLHRPADAEKGALTAVKLRPDNARLYLVLANIHNELQNDAAMLDDLNNYLKLAPTGPFSDQARQQQKQLQQELGDAQKTPAAAAPSNP